MADYRWVGAAPGKRHTQDRDPDGGLYCEELTSEQGFSLDSSLLCHREIPSALVDARPRVLAVPKGLCMPLVDHFAHVWPNLLADAVGVIPPGVQESPFVLPVRVSPARGESLHQACVRGIA